MTHSGAIKVLQKTLGISLLVTAALAFATTPARASTIGFTGSFSFDNTSSDSTYWDPNTQCDPDGPATYCVDLDFPEEGVLFIPQDSISSSTWTWSNDSTQIYYVSFEWSLETDSPTDSITISANNAIIGSRAGAGLGTSIINQAINPGNTLVFTINGISGNNTAFVVQNFNFDVPGPLPATGAATAFGLSRRLRRRIKGELPPSSRKPTKSTHPSSYLNLSPTALHGLPATFSYSATPHRPTLAHSFPSRHGLPAMPPAPALEPAANDITTMQA